MCFSIKSHSYKVWSFSKSVQITNIFMNQLTNDKMYVFIEGYVDLIPG